MTHEALPLRTATSPLRSPVALGGDKGGGPFLNRRPSPAVLPDDGSNDGLPTGFGELLAHARHGILAFTNPRPPPIRCANRSWTGRGGAHRWRQLKNFPLSLTTFPPFPGSQGAGVIRRTPIHVRRMVLSRSPRRASPPISP